MKTSPPLNRRPRAPTLRAALLSLLPLVAACATAPSPWDGADAGPDLRRSITVVNENFQDVRVYLVIGAGRHPLGFVQSERSRTFRVSPALLGPDGLVHLAADPTGGGPSHDSREIALGFGERLIWTLSVNPRLSSYTIR